MIGSSFQNHKICTLLIGYSDTVRKSKSMKPRFTTERSQVLSAVSGWRLRLLEILPAHQPGGLRDIERLTESVECAENFSCRRWTGWMWRMHGAETTCMCQVRASTVASVVQLYASRTTVPSRSVPIRCPSAVVIYRV